MGGLGRVCSSFLIAVLVGCNGCTSSKPAPERPFGRIPQAVESQNPIIQEGIRRNVVVNNGCSGVVLRTGIVLTAAHCFRLPATVDGQPAEVRLIGIGQSKDFMELSTETVEAEPLQYATPYPGQQVFAVSNVDNFKSVVSFGHVMHVGETSFLTNVVAVPGVSGSVIYSLDGKLLGLQTQYYMRHFTRVGPTAEDVIGSVSLRVDKIPPVTGS